MQVTDTHRHRQRHKHTHTHTERASDCYENPLEVQIGQRSPLRGVNFVYSQCVFGAVGTGGVACVCVRAAWICLLCACKHVVCLQVCVCMRKCALRHR